MTDNDIIKALERCKSGKCNTCGIVPFDGDCEKMISQMSLDLINRQKAEIEEYEKVVGKLGRKDGKVVCVLKGKETEYIPTSIANVHKKLAISKAKAEAIKECTERVIEKTLAMVYSLDLLSTKDYIECIESVKKEMVGDV